MNAVIKIFNYRFYLKEILFLFICYLMMEEMFSWLLVPDSSVIQNFEKGSSLLISAFMVFSFFQLKPMEKIYIGVFTVLMVKLILESLYIFNTVFQQLTMFYVLFPVVFAIFIKHVCRKFDLDVLGFIAKFYLLTYVVFMVWYGRGFSFSLAEIEMNDYGPFSGDGRIIHASKIYMMIIPFLWYLNKFIVTAKFKYLLPIAFCFVAILVHQHRSVWSCTIVSLLIYIGLSIRANSRTLPKVYTIGVGSVIVLLLAHFFISNLVPGFIDFLSDRFSEIFDPSKVDSTGKFRADQREVYFKLFLHRPFFGWTFEGFEMPNPLVDWWPEKTGQHFHEGYMEMLFYHGIVGFVFKFSLFIYIGIRAFSRKLKNESLIMISFCLSGLLFSFNYVLPIIFWGHLGLCLYYIERDLLAGSEVAVEKDISRAVKNKKITEVKQEVYDNGF